MTKIINSAFAQPQTTLMERIYKDVFNQEPKYDCTYRVEVRTSDGAIRFYGLRAIDKSYARQEAASIIQHLLNSSPGERILWRMAGENKWNLNTLASEKKPSLFKRTMNYFFDLEDEE